MNIFSRRKALAVFLFTISLTTQTTAIAARDAVPPNPVLAFLGAEYIEAGGKRMTRYYYDVANKESYPADMFAAAPTLPPCGQNNNASRTWIDIYDLTGHRLNGFCALGKPSDLTSIWFALPEEEVPPSWVYIEFTDRKTNTKYKSNLAETTL
ncbi:MAG TPA: hypothetical protein VGJ37_04250 [Pyrinomonadaceae bacterium]|jgi:hypothetical protein